MIVLTGFSLRNAIVGALIIFSAAIAVFPPAPLSPMQARTLAIVLVTLLLWSTSIVPNFLAALLFFAVTLTLGLAPADLVFSGFASAAVWLIVSGFVIGSAINLSGLGDRLAAFVAPALTGSYPRLIAGLMLTAMLLAFLMPSSIGRAVALMPVGMALAGRCGFPPGSPGRIGIAVTLAIGCNMPSFAILPANIPNMVLSGAAETIHGVHFLYLDYLLLHYPVLGIVKSVLIVLLVLKIFPAKVGNAAAEATAATEAAPEKPSHATSTAVQLRTGAILLLTLAFWATDSLHGINPAWIGLAAAVALMLPGIGTVPPASFRASADFGTVLFVAGALALGAVVNASGLGAMAGAFLENWLPMQQGRDALNFMSLVVMAFATGLFTTVPGAPAVLTPMAGDLAALTGFSLESVLMTQVIGFSTVLLPYQVAPLVVAMQLSGEKLAALPKILLPLAALTLLLLVPLDYLWWQLLGWI